MAQGVRLPQLMTALMSVSILGNQTSEPSDRSKKKVHVCLMDSGASSISPHPYPFPSSNSIRL